MMLTLNLANLTRHARKRVDERALDRGFLEELADRTSAILSDRPLKFRHRGITLVAQKTAGGTVRIITAWKETS